METAIVIALVLTNVFTFLAWKKERKKKKLDGMILAIRDVSEAVVNMH